VKYAAGLRFCVLDLLVALAAKRELPGDPVS